MKKKILFILILMLAFVLLSILLINRSIAKAGTKMCKDDNESQVALVLGARVYASGRMSDIFRDRVETGARLYEEGRVAKVLVSGDHGREEYDEVNAAKEYLLERGVKPEDIFLDHAGFDTYDSVYRAKEIFGVVEAMIVTQDFHLPRALYIADKLGMDACGVSADLNTYRGAARWESREILARLKAWLDILRGAKPKFLGEPIPIGGNGRKTWD